MFCFRVSFFGLFCFIFLFYVFIYLFYFPFMDTYAYIFCIFCFCFCFYICICVMHLGVLLLSFTSFLVFTPLVLFVVCTCLSNLKTTWLHTVLADIAVIPAAQNSFVKKKELYHNWHTYIGWALFGQGLLHICTGYCTSNWRGSRRNGNTQRPGKTCSLN